MQRVISRSEQRFWNGKNQAKNSTRFFCYGTIIESNGTVIESNGTVVGCTGTVVDSKGTVVGGTGDE